MSIKTRAAARLAKHLAFILGSMLLIYIVFLSVPASVALMIMGGAGAAFFGYHLFMIYVSMEEMDDMDREDNEMAKNRKK